MKISLDIGNNPKLWEKFLNFFVRQCLVRTSIQGKNLPDLYRSKIAYQRETGEYWQRPEETHELGFGDCEDLAIYRVCELRRSGIPARCRVRRSRNNPHQYHCIVEIIPGVYEDPSALRGMYGTMHGDYISGDEAPAVPSGAFLPPQGAMMPGMNPGAPMMPGMMPGMNPLMMSPYGAVAMMAMPYASQGASAVKKWWKRRKHRRADGE